MVNKNFLEKYHINKHLHINYTVDIKEKIDIIIKW